MSDYVQTKRTAIPPRASLYSRPHDEVTEVTELVIQKPTRAIRRQRSFLMPFIAGVLIVLSASLSWILFVIPWWTGVQEQWHLGDAKVSTLFADVGHGGQSEFIALAYHGQETIIEIVQQKATVYIGGTFVGADQMSRVVTLSVQDVNGDGKPDLVIHVAGMNGATVLFNTGSAFSWTSKS